MYQWDIFFVMVGMALAMRCLRNNEWLSASVVTFVLGGAVLIMQPSAVRILYYQMEPTTPEKVYGLWFAVCCFACARTVCRDIIGNIRDHFTNRKAPLFGGAR